MSHFAFPYSQEMNRLLHIGMDSSWYYKHEIYEIPGLLTALLITHLGQKNDEFEVNTEVSYYEFLERMRHVKYDWEYFDINNFQSLAKEPHRLILGSEGQTFYFIRGGNHPEYWTPEQAYNDLMIIIQGKLNLSGVMTLNMITDSKTSIPPGRKHYRDYENMVRRVID